MAEIVATKIGAFGQQRVADPHEPLLIIQVGLQCHLALFASLNLSGYIADLDALGGRGTPYQQGTKQNAHNR
jgi:hypothetical protein